MIISGDDSAMVTCGVKHINFWKHCGNALQTRKGKLMNKAGEIQSQMCVVFGEEDNCYSGTLSGKLIFQPIRREKTVHSRF